MKKLFKGGDLSPSKIGGIKSASGNIADLKTKSISEIAGLVRQDWQNVNYAAEPYLEAMMHINNISDRYMFDDGRTVVAYFLSNASSWKGPVAKQIKLELNRRLKTSRNQMQRGGKVDAGKFVNKKFAKWILDAKKSKKNIAIDYYDDDQLSAWTISPSGKLMQERTFDYDKESDVMNDVDQARKLIFVDQAFRCGGQPKKMANGGKTTTYADEILKKSVAETNDYQFNKWLKETYPKIYDSLNSIGFKSATAKRMYFLKTTMLKPELAATIEPGDTVHILTTHGNILKGRAVMKSRGLKNTWVINTGGEHGTPKIASEENIVDVIKSNSDDEPPATQMGRGGKLYEGEGRQLNSYRAILESIPKRQGINPHAVEFSRQMLEDAAVDEIPIDDHDVQLLIQKIEAYPLIEVEATEVIDTPPAEPLPPASKKMLETRLRIIKKMIAKNPENKTLSLRARIIQKMISKLK